MDECMAANRLMLAGTVAVEPVFSHAVRGVDFYKFTLSVERASGTADVLPVLIRVDRLLAPLNAGSFAAVTGQLRSYAFTTADGVERLLINAYARCLSLPDGPVNLNETRLSGTLVRPPVYRTTPRLREITDLLLAVPRGFGREDLIPLIAWGGNARRARELAPGDRINATGRLQSRSYTKLLPDGAYAERMTYELSLSTFELL